MNNAETVKEYLESNHIDYLVMEDGKILAGNSVEERFLEMVARYAEDEFGYGEDFLKSITLKSTLKDLGIDKPGLEILIDMLNEEYDAKWKYNPSISGSTTLAQVAKDFKAYLTELRLKGTR